MKGLIFIYLVSYGGSFFALFNPFVGLCAYYMFAILRPQTLWEWALVGSNYSEPFSRYLALSTMIGFIVVFFKENRPDLYAQKIPTKQKLSLAGGGLALIALFGMAVMAKLSTAYIPESPGFIDTEYSAALTKISIMMAIGYYLLNSLDRIRIFLWVLFLSQFYLTFEINVIYFVQGTNRILWDDGFGSLNNNGFAMSLLPCIGLALIFSLYERSPYLKWTAILSALSSLHVVLLAESRGAYLGLVVIAGMVIYLLPWNFKTLFIFLLLFVVAMVLIGESVQNEFMTIFVDEQDRDKSAEGRFALWSVAFKVMKDNPVLGLGPGRFNDFYYRYHGGADDKWKSPHSLYLRLGAECGMIALFLCIIFYSSIIFRCYSILKQQREKDPFIRGVIGGCLAGVLGFLVHSIFADGLTIESTFAVILPALAIFRLKYSERRQRVPYGNKPRVVRYATG